MPYQQTQPIKIYTSLQWDVMHLSMFSPRGGGPGIPGGFDILFNSRVNFPAVGTISCVKCPSPRRKILQCLAEASTIKLNHYALLNTHLLAVVNN